MTVNAEQSLRQRREAIVTEHVEAENRHDVGATIATFHQQARYEVNGETSDGEAAVRDLLQDLMAGFPDFHVEIKTIHHADDAVIGEGRITGTHEGPFGGLPATGRAVDYPAVAIFEFEEDRLQCEKVYFDSATILTQIGVLPEPADPPGR
jgi:steroid delta-isomerase-like uncharacterized protein